MIKFIIFFLWIVSFYHILNTFLVWKLGFSKSIVSISKEIIWFSFILILILLNFKKFFEFLRKYLILVIILLSFTLWAISISIYNGVSLKQILIGFKYDILPLYILMSTIFLGYLIWDEKRKLNLVYKIYNFLYIFLILNLVVGILKIIFPNFFYLLGYGPLRDFTPNVAPPVYYTSGYGGISRLSGLFGGPNELGFFLVFILPFLRYVGRKMKVIIKILKLNKKQFLFFDKLYLFGLFEGILTLSRGFVLGIVLEGILIFYKKIIRYLFLSFIFLFVSLIGLFFLNKTRPLSTNDHIILTQIGIEKVRENPLGYGLGSSGPSAFYTKQGLSLYEIKKSVPENTYLQIAIDTGIFGLFLFLFFWILFIIQGFQNNKGKGLLGNIRLMLLFGIIGLMVEGIFLHIFGDSMVVYLVMIILGILIG